MTFSAVFSWGTSKKVNENGGFHNCIWVSSLRWSFFEKRPRHFAVRLYHHFARLILLIIGNKLENCNQMRPISSTSSKYENLRHEKDVRWPVNVYCEWFSHVEWNCLQKTWLVIYFIMQWRVQWPVWTASFQFVTHYWKREYQQCGVRLIGQEKSKNTVRLRGVWYSNASIQGIEPQFAYSRTNEASRNRTTATISPWHGLWVTVLH